METQIKTIRFERRTKEMGIIFDDKHLESFVGENELKAIAPQVKLAHDQLNSKTGFGSDFLGWMDLPVNYDKD